MMLDVLLEKYNNNTILRTLVNLIPSYGGSIDIFLSNRWSKIQQRRIEEQLSAFVEALSGLEGRVAELELDIATSEGLYDILYQILDNSLKSRCPESRYGYARVLREAIVDNNAIPDLEEVVYQIADMRERDYLVLRAVKDLFDFGVEVSGETISTTEKVQMTPIEAERQLFRFENMGLLDHPRNRTTRRGGMTFEKTEYFDKVISFLFK